MTVDFVDEIPDDRHEEIGDFLTGNKIDDDVDVRMAARSTKDGTYAKITGDWHPDSQGRHLTVEVYVDHKRIHTAHVYENGQITAYS